MSPMPIPLELLRCPVSEQGLHLGSSQLLADLLTKQSSALLLDVSGQQVTGKLEQLLVREDATIGYPVVNGIPILLPGSGIPV